MNGSPPRSGTLSDLIRPGSVVALGDGAGAPASVHAELSAVAREKGDVTLVLGWVLAGLEGLELDAFARVVALMGGYSVRAEVDAGRIEYLPVRLGTTPSLLSSTLRPGVLVASARAGASGYTFTTEVGWQRAVVLDGANVAVVERPSSPRADRGASLPTESITIIGSCDDRPVQQRWPEPSDVDRAMAQRVLPYIRTNDRLQYAPGPAGAALLEALTVPVQLDGGTLTDGAVQLADRGLLSSNPLATYLVGTDVLYDWAEGRALLDGVEHTHDPGRLRAGAPLIAVNTALQIDGDGQVNVERVGGSVVAGIGGQPDFAAAAATSMDGISILAVPTHRGRRSTLVDQLDGPVSTPSHDVDVIVTEQGSRDLRGLDRAARRRAIASLWE